jgi:hypothetical protein
MEDLRMNVSSLAVAAMITLVTATASALEFDKHIISDAIDGACSVHAADIDQDGDLDVFAAAFYADSVTLWVNHPGESPQWVSETMITGFDGAHWVDTGDLDGDGDLDIVAASQLGGEIVWWRNDGGSASLWPRFEIVNDYAGAQQARPIDMDGDGDRDLVSSAYLADEVSWWRNDGGDPIEWVRHTIATGSGGPVSVQAADLDGDGDHDVVTASYNSARVDWWRNDGDTWTGITLSDTFRGAHEVAPSDLDNDGDTDVVAVAYGLSDVAWWRNDGGSPLEWTQLVIDGSFGGAASVSTADLDHDGDLDVIATAQGAGDVAWWTNQGGDPIEWTKATIDPSIAEVWPHLACDLDGDGDLDILVGAHRADVVAWYENTGTGSPRRVRSVPGGHRVVP